MRVNRGGSKIYMATCRNDGPMRTENRWRMGLPVQTPSVRQIDDDRQDAEVQWTSTASTEV